MSTRLLHSTDVVLLIITRIVNLFLISGVCGDEFKSAGIKKSLFFFLKHLV